MELEYARESTLCHPKNLIQLTWELAVRPQKTGVEHLKSEVRHPRQALLNHNRPRQLRLSRNSEQR